MSICHSLKSSAETSVIPGGRDCLIYGQPVSMGVQEVCAEREYGGMYLDEFLES